jgi:biofilm PGA synthesis N-glycosyltransferase PgaC
MDSHTEAPIFFDHKGRRWNKIRFILVVLALAVGGSVYYLAPKVLDHSSVQPMKVAATPGDAQVADSASGMSPAEITALISRKNTPVIGKGPLVRMIHIQVSGHVKYAVPLYAKTGAVPLTSDEQLIIGDHEFALQRYGQSTVSKQIALTFDDGPDPKYTPQILDMLAHNKVQATFFAVGANVVKYPAVAARAAQEGHVVANHTFDHVDFDFVSEFQAEQEISQANRTITAVTHHSNSFFRLPYMGNDEQSLRNHITGILTAQRQGYVVASNDFDSDDWDFTAGYKPKMPAFDGSSMVVLLHDAGGDRTQTVKYTQQLITEAKAHGYTFVTLNQMYSQKPSLYAPVAPSMADRASLFAAKAYLVYPRVVVSKLFFFTVGMLFLSMVVNVVLAVWNMRRQRYKQRPDDYDPLVSVVISAFNEEEVLEKTVKSILDANYKNLEMIIVDDGSKDNTGAVAKQLAEKYDRVRAFSKKNGGKASGLNYAIERAKGEIIIGIDADTVFPPETVDNLVRHFADPKVGAVAGNVKVGNIHNTITRWQMLDYTIGIYLERNAQAALGAVLIVPGACGAWRKSVVLAAGGYKHVTLAEDADLTLSVHELGYKVLQDNSAISYTEAPDTLKVLAKQRYRWMYGTLQAFWKHRGMFFNRKYGWAGMFVMPLSILNAFLPVFFIPIIMIINLENMLAGNFRTIALFFLATIAIQAITACIAVILARESWRHLLAVPFTRLIYSPIRTTLLYRTVGRALRGAYAGSVWNTARTGTVTTPAQEIDKLSQALAMETPQVVPVTVSSGATTVSAEDTGAEAA